MLAHTRIDRYEIKDILGQGGMGIVYRAYDPERKGYVALKTMRDAANPAALDMFNQEWRTLANLSHPNIVDVLNCGSFDDEGQKKPYFVMPLLPGTPLDKLIKESGHLLTMPRVIEILVQTCRGLQAAHASGLVHRDLKPSNLFVLSDDSVKIIDFGMVHLSDAAKSATGIKGTLHYMAPEQIEMKEVTPATDIFALGVVAYEALTGRKPFDRPSDRAIVDAIRREFPPAISELNPAVDKIVAQVIAKAMAKNPWNRYSTAREFSDYLQRAFRGEVIEGLDPARLQPRLERARRALAESDFDYAHEILNELQLEGYLDSDITLLLDQVREASRNRAIRQLIDSARTRLQEDEFPLAWQKIQEALQRDPGNTEALQLQAEIETRRGDQQIEKWRQLVHQHLHNNAFSQARHAIEEIRKIRSDDPTISELLHVTERRQQDYQKACEEKEQHFQSAMRAYGSGEISAALSKLEKILTIDSRSPGLAQSGRDEVYRESYEKIRSEWENVQHAVADIERSITTGDLARAAELVNEHSAKYPNDLGLQALKLKVDDLLRQQKSAYIADIGQRVESEPDLNRKVQYLDEALARYPNEAHLEELAASLRKRRDLVESVITKARQCEEQGMMSDALSQWTTLRHIHPQYPGLEFEIERVTSACELQTRQEAKLEWVNRIDQILESGDYERAYNLAGEALQEFPGDSELQTIRRLADEARGKSSQALHLAEEAQTFVREKRYPEAIHSLRSAVALDPHNSGIRGRLADTLAAQAQVLLASDWRASESLVQEALQFVPDHGPAKSLRPTVLLAKRTEFIDHCASEVRELQARGELSQALDKIQQGLAAYPNDGRLAQLQNMLREQLRAARDRDLQELRVAADQASDQTSLTALLEKSIVLSRNYPGDREVSAAVGEIDRKLQATGGPAAAATAGSGATAVPARERRPETAAPSQPEPLSESQPSPAALHPIRVRLTEGGGPVVRRAQEWAGSARARFARLPRYERVLVWVALVILLLAAGILAVRSRSHVAVATVPSAPTTTVTIANADGATVMIDGTPVTGSVVLGQTAHHLVATKLGYKTIEQTVKPGPQPSTVVLDFEPEPHSIHISADLPAGRVLLDDAEIGVLQNGNFVYDLKGDAAHTLKLVDGNKEVFTVQFETKAGEPARLTYPPLSRDLPVVVVTRLGTRGSIWSSVPGIQITLRGDTGALSQQGQELSLQPNDTEVAVNTGAQSVTIPIESGNAPLIAIRSGVSNKGTLAIETNIPEADVYIDGRKSSRRVQNGKWFGQFDPGEHRVSVVQDGFDRPTEQKILVAAGKRSATRFDLVRTVTSAFLRIDGGTPDAEVSLDGRVVGRTNPAGAFGPIEVAPDVEHSIRLHKENYEAGSDIRRRIDVRSTAALSGAEVKLKPFGTIEVAVEPPDARVMIGRAGEPLQPLRATTLSLREGDYRLTASADPSRYASTGQAVRVVSGQTVQVRLTVPLKNAPLPQTAVRVDVPDLFSVRDWQKLDDGFWFHQGAAPVSKTAFAQTFEFKRIRKTFGQENIVWRTYTQGADFIEFQVDGTNLKRRVFANGKGGPTVSRPHEAGRSEIYRLSLSVDPERIVIKVGRISEEIPVKVAGQTVFDGKFAVRIVR